MPLDGINQENSITYSEVELSNKELMLQKHHQSQFLQIMKYLDLDCVWNNIVHQPTINLR